MCRANDIDADAAAAATDGYDVTGSCPGLRCLPDSVTLRLSEAHPVARGWTDRAGSGLHIGPPTPRGVSATSSDATSN